MQFFLTSIFALNKASHSSTLASRLLVIMTTSFDYDCNISNLVISLSIIIPIDVVESIKDGLAISFDVLVIPFNIGTWLGTRIVEEQ